MCIVVCFGPQTRNSYAACGGRRVSDYSSVPYRSPINLLCRSVVERRSTKITARTCHEGAMAAGSTHWRTQTRRCQSAMQGSRSWGLGSLDPMKISRRVRVCFDPLKCHILSFKTLLLLVHSASFASSRMMIVSKMEGKTNFYRRQKPSDGLT